MTTAVPSAHVCCESSLLEHPRYFPRQLITPGDLTLEHTYFQDKLRRHNRLLHGWGVVCGALVCPVYKQDKSGLEPWKVCVEPGYILGPYGDEILIDCARTVDLRSSGVTGMCGEPPSEVVDPWCSEVYVKPEAGPLYVAVKYKEIMTRPVRVQPVGCGCDDTQCEYSRWRDAYEIGFLKDRPTSHLSPPCVDKDGKVTLECLVEGGIPACPPCPPEPWVVLARVELGQDGEITKIDNCFCRRLVISFGRFWWKCDSRPVTINKDGVTVTGSLKPGENVTLSVKGENFQEGLTASLGNGVTVTAPLTVKQDLIEISAHIAQNAIPGARTMTITNPDCSTATLKDAITIEKPPSPQPTPAPDNSSTAPPSRPPLRRRR